VQEHVTQETDHGRDGKSRVGSTMSEQLLATVSNRK
jgi:hypothetical protein